MTFLKFTFYRLGWVILLLISSFTVFSQSRQFRSSNLVDGRLHVIVSDGEYVISSYTNSSFEVVFNSDGVKEVSSNAISSDLRSLSPLFKETDGQLQFSIGDLSAVVQKNPFSLSFYQKDKFLISESAGFFKQDSIVGFSFNLTPDEKLMGGGERVLGMNRRGNRLQLYNKAHYGYETHSELMYYSLPVVISSSKYMLIFDNGASGYLDLGKTNKDVLQFEATGGRTSYLVVGADDWKALASSYTELTGRQPLPPRWALGNIASRMGYHSQREVESVVAKYRQDQIPLDGIVLDLYWFGQTLQGTLGALDWYRDSFPKPEEMLANNKSKGVKTILITEPFILSSSKKFAECRDQQLLAKNNQGEPYLYNFYFGNTALLDMFKPETKDWFWSIYKHHTLSGVDGWWGDLGEPEVHPDDILHVNGRGHEVHNIYGHEWAKLLHDGFKTDFPQTRPVILMRSGFVGSQRYGLMPWSGDVSRSWSGLKPQVEISLQMGMQGLGYMSSDLGGFAGAYKDSELYVRWLQYGVFQPVYRTHGQEEVPAEPIYWDASTKALAKEAINLRYQLMPYNYTLAYENASLGLPLMRPLFYQDSNPKLLDVTNQYFWGDNFMVYPVTDKGIKSVDVYMPNTGYWFDFFNPRSIYNGGSTISYSVKASSIPVFVKAGSFIPMATVTQSTSTYSSAKLRVNYYHHNSVQTSAGYLYEDDGVTSHSIENNRYEIVRFSSQNDANSLKISTLPQGYFYNGKPECRSITMVINNLDKKPKNVVVDGKKVAVKSGVSTKVDLKSAVWDKSSKSLLVTYEVSNKAVELTISK